MSRYEADIIDFDFRDYEKAKQYLKSNPYPIPFVQKRYSKELLNNENYAIEKKFRDYKEKKNGEIIRQIYHRALRDYIIKKDKILFIRENPNEYFIWNGRYYENKREDYLLSLLEKIVLENDDVRGLTSNEVGTFLTQFRVVERETTSNLLAKKEGYMPFNNGVLNTKTLEFHPHSEKLFFTFCLPYNYTVQKDVTIDDIYKNTPNWTKLMKLIMCKNEGLIKVFEFYLGYVLSQEISKNNQYFLLLYGEGNNGKSFLLDVIRNMLTLDLLTTQKLDQMDGENRFASAAIEGKILILNDDASENIFKQSDFLKRLVGGNETIIIEKKGVDPYEIRAVAKPIITTNKIPYIPDVSYGFKRRFLSIPLLLNTKEVNHKDLIIDSDGDKKMFIKEYPYIIHKCLSLYYEYKNSNRKIEDEIEEVKESTERLIIYSNPLEEWYNEKLYYSGDISHKIPIKILYDVYCANFDTNPRHRKKLSNFVVELEEWSRKIVRKKNKKNKEEYDKDIFKKYGVHRSKLVDINIVYSCEKDEIWVSDIPSEVLNDYSNKWVKVKKRSMNTILQGFIYESQYIKQNSKEEDEELEF